MKKMICFGIVLLVFLCACKKPVRYSVIPKIRFISFEKLQQEKGKLTFYFQDGDGDIGLDDWQTMPPYNYNFFCSYYEKQNGVFVKVDSILDPKGEMYPFNLNARIPRLSTLPEESIDGEIAIVFSPSYFDSFSPYSDTVSLEFYILDRQLNKSNVEQVTIIRK